MYKGVIYKPIIEHNGQTKFYFASTANHWKTQYDHHKMTITNKQYSNATVLSTFFWEIKTDSYTPVVNWNFIAKIKPFISYGGKYNLYL